MMELIFIGSHYAYVHTTGRRAVESLGSLGRSTTGAYILIVNSCNLILPN
uniref:Uncharacterized protein n=1 Tax=Arundo donax TaxID=35708 RepID=A0A0A9JFT0_ARUDO